MSDDKRGIPDDIPMPEAPTPAAAGEAEVSEEQLKGLMDGSLNFQDFLSLSDEVLLSWANQGYFLFNQGKYEESATIFRGLVTLNSKVAYYHTALGSIYEAQEKYDEALTEFDSALGIDGNDICALVNRGEIRLRQGDVLEAAEDFKKAIELDDANTQAQVAAGQKIEPDPAASRARALSVVTYEVLKEIQNKVEEAQARGEVIE